MISIQDLGMQILNHKPQKFYVFGGIEYGIKMRYIDELEKYYGKKEEHQSVSDLLSFMNTKHIIPLGPCVYVVRYDEVFASQINEKFANRIKNSKINGTIVCIYDSDKIITKMNKYIPNYTAVIDVVNPQFVAKYLKSDFPKLSDRLINIAVNSTSDYGQAKNMCYSMMLDFDNISKLQDNDIEKLFGRETISTSTQLRIGIASRNFNYLINIIENYDGTLDDIIFTMIQVMIDLDKIKTNKRTQLDIAEYGNYWSVEDIYYMFMHCYDQLMKIRSLSSYDPYDSLIYLIGLLKFQRIPSLEVMKS